MTRPYLFDTNVLLVWARGGEHGRDIEKRFGANLVINPPLISIVNVAEIRVLANRNGWGDRRIRMLLELTQRCVIVDIVPEIVDAYVKVEAASRRAAQGSRTMGQNDMWIAATAKVASATLLTTDKDFDHLAGAFIAVEHPGRA